MVPFLKSPEDAQKAAQLYQRLLELNQSLLMAKFSIDDDLDVVLSVEYPSGELDRSEFDDAIDVLSYYADRHYDELRALAG
ncbi:MAG: YbjN domain-containing protein [Sandaracinaceae bacterium]|nr:YbjN domain-containing protein [Sandaracinaceae bacterium]